MSTGHRHLEEVDLLELLLDGQRLEERTQRLAALRTCTECAQRLDLLASFVERAREAAELGFEPTDDAPLVQRILSATTREDASPRGDLRLVWRFAVARLRASAVLRVAAAILVAHLIALPVLAWIVLREPAPSGHFSGVIVLPHDPVYPREIEEEPEREPTADLPESDPPLIDVEDGERDSALGWLDVARRNDLARWRALAPKSDANQPATDEVARLLDLRAQQLAGAAIEIPALGAQASIDAQALRVELLLDRWAVTGIRPSTLELDLTRLVADDAVERSALAACSLHRAAAFGALTGPRWNARVQGTGAVSAIARRLAREPLEGVWLDALAELSRAERADRARAIGAWLAPRR